MMNPYVQSLFAVTEIELMYRNQVLPENRPIIYSSNTAYDILLNCWDMNKIELVEDFMILLLDRSNYCLGISRVARGTISACLVDPKIVFATALKAKASGIILAHNHPSGIETPSIQDKRLTKKLKDGGDLLDLNVYDHIIVTPHSYYSFVDNGEMPLSGSPPHEPVRLIP
jgi:DNA repair protein RadC